MADETCCVIECERPLDKTYWDNQYQANATGWDLGQPSPPIKAYFDAVQNKDARILIPGCGNAYEAEYLIQQGFTNITLIDIAPTLTEKLQKQFSGNKQIQILNGDFFEHQGEYDYVVEQTFFCALPPTMRQKYVWKMFQLLAPKGKLVGLLFNRTFESGPPFGGSKPEYELLFKGAFVSRHFETATNSITPRANAELFIELEKNTEVQVNIYHLEGITCLGCKSTVTEKLLALPDALNVSINTAYSEVIVTSKREIDLALLQDTLQYDAKYKISKLNDKLIQK